MDAVDVRNMVLQIPERALLTLRRRASVLAVEPVPAITSPVRLRTNLLHPTEAHAMVPNRCACARAS